MKRTDSSRKDNLAAVEDYYKTSKNKKRIIIFLFIFTIAFSFFALSKGSAQVSFMEIMEAFHSKENKLANIVLWNNRLPRVLTALIAGVGLSIAGCIMQTTLANPLASPSTLGVSNAAAFGANIAIGFFGAGAIQNVGQSVAINSPYLTTFFAFAFSMLATLTILSLARLRGFTPETMVLVGVAISSLFSAGSILIQYFSTDSQVAAMVFWTFGDLGRVSWNEIKILFLATSITFIYFLFKRWDYNACDSGVEVAKSLGVNVDRLRFNSMLIASFLTSVMVSFMGMIAFVGLVAPQMMRRVLGVDHRFLIPASAITGGLLLLFSDTLARTIIAPIILPVGAITSFLGAPLFLYLLVKGVPRG